MQALGLVISSSLISMKTPIDSESEIQAALGQGVWGKWVRAGVTRNPLLKQNPVTLGSALSPTSQSSPASITNPKSDHCLPAQEATTVSVLAMKTAPSWLPSYLTAFMF